MDQKWLGAPYRTSSCWHLSDLLASFKNVK